MIEKINRIIEKHLTSDYNRKKRKGVFAYE